MKEWFFKVWKDAVWSKVIAASIIGTAVSIWSYFNWKEIKEVIKAIIDFKFNVIYVLAIIIALYLCYRLIKYSKGKRPTKEEINFEILKDFNSMDNKNNTMHFSWQVGLSTITHKPYIHNITCFCILHDFPLRFKHHCKDGNCNNYNVIVDEHDLKNWIESALYDDWKRLNGNI